MFTFIIFILILGILVFVHEAGHFTAARKLGIKVYEFGFGMPPRLFGIRRVVLKREIIEEVDQVSINQSGEVKEEIVIIDEKIRTKKWQIIWGNKMAEELDEEARASGLEPDVIYSINLLPLGGFVKIKGENGELGDEPDSFGAKKAWQRILVLFSGVTMNFILAAVLLSIGFIIGLPTDVSTLNDKQAMIIGESRVLIQQVEKNSPAEKSGIKFGDEILSIDGTKILNSAQMTDYVKTKDGTEIKVGVKRGDEEKDFMVKPEKFAGLADYPRIGVALADAAMIRYPWYIALYKGFIAAGVGVVNILLAFYFLLKNLILGHGLLMDVSGPVGIAVFVGQSARLGINYLLNTTAMISLSLAVINALPIPALDGGRILFIMIEKIIRRKLPMKYEQMAHTIGFLALMALIVVVTFRDVKGLF
jgi:regulator of sigma E protease